MKMVTHAAPLSSGVGGVQIQSIGHIEPPIKLTVGYSFST